MARRHVTIRLSEEAVAAVDDLAREHDLHRTEVLRQAIRLAFSQPTKLREMLTESRTRL